MARKNGENIIFQLLHLKVTQTADVEVEEAVQEERSNRLLGLKSLPKQKQFHIPNSGIKKKLAFTYPPPFPF